jgi:hypothetical protein
MVLKIKVQYTNINKCRPGSETFLLFNSPEGGRVHSVSRVEQNGRSCTILSSSAAK